MKIILFILPFLLLSCSTKPEKNVLDKITIQNDQQITLGKENWSGDKDCSAKGNISIQGDNLLIHLEIKDDVLSNQGDNVELFFNVRPYRLKDVKRYTEGVVQIRLHPWFSKSHPNQATFHPDHYPSKINGTIINSEKLNGENGYSINVKIPVDGFKENHYPLHQDFYFDVSINDNDNGNESQITYHGDKDNWQDPTNFKLVKINK